MSNTSILCHCCPCRLIFPAGVLRGLFLKARVRRASALGVAGGTSSHAFLGEGLCKCVPGTLGES